MRFREKITCLLLLALASIYFLQKIDLTTVDLGRHIRNGEYFLKDPKVLYTNFYSYTEPSFETVNHHWLFGFLTYLIWSVGNFKLISIIFAVINLSSFFLLFLSAKKSSSFTIALFASLWLIPIIAARKEIRPEMISYLFLAIFLFYLVRFKNGEITFKKLCVLLLLVQLLWVNTHIFFIFGLLLAGVLTVKNIPIKKLLFLLLALVLTSLINPAGIKGFLEPFNIFKEYGYMVAENQSVIFMQKRFYNPLYFHFELSFIMIFCGFFILLLKSRMDFKRNLPLFGLFLIFGLLAFRLNRLIAMSGMMFLFTGSSVMKEIFNCLPKKYGGDGGDKKLITSFLGSVFFILYLIPNNYSSVFNNNFGIGALAENEKSAEFFIETALHGPIFNNYDIGSYLIFHLFPNERVFVDNRPEAYPTDFFKGIYIPMQEDEKTWEIMDRKYNFNIIYFYRHDLTPWGQPFLIKRLGDVHWAPIYVDEAVLIMAKNNDENKNIIEKYKLPKNIFGH